MKVQSGGDLDAETLLHRELPSTKTLTRIHVSHDQL